MKLHAERLGNDAAWNTHTMFNAVPQRAKLNSGIWLDLENLTAAWAQHFGRVWIITGPIFGDGHAYGFIGEPDKNEKPIAIPEALFKIVVKDSGHEGEPDVLAFIYPQIGPGYTSKLYDHRRYLTPVAEIENLTALKFFTNLSDSERMALRKQQSTSLWDSHDEDFIEACCD